MEVHVRFGTEKDFPFVKELAKECCSYSIHPIRKASLEQVRLTIDQIFDNLSKMWSNLPNHRLLLLEKSDKNERIGYLIFMLDQIEATTGEKQTFLVDTAILPKYWGKSLWKPLFQKAEELARERGNLYLCTTTTTTNPRSLTKNIRFGFHIERYQLVKVLD